MSLTTTEQHQVYAGMVRKQMLIAGLLIIGLVGLGSRLFQMQVLEQERYIRAAQRNRLEEVPQPAPRGEILDRYDTVLAASVPQYDVTFYVPGTPLSDWTWIPALAALLRLPEGTTENWQELIEAAKPFTRVVLVKDVPLARLIELAERQAEYPGVTITTRTKRSYPLAQSASHLLGYVGAISPQEFERLGPMGYRRDDEIGKGGLEQQYDARLRGVPGHQYLEVDHRGRVQGRLLEPILLDPQTGLSLSAESPPQQGPALRTTLDAELQEGVARLMQGYRGAAIAMDVHTGELLAAVSSPSYDPNLFGPAAPVSDVKALFDDPHKPVLNRFMAGAYIPGSVWKIVTQLAGLEERLVTEQTTFYCDGVFTLANQEFKCHRLSGHGSQNATQAMANSCDEYYYQLGHKLGVDRISKWAHYFGFGEPTGIDLPQEAGALVPTSQWKRDTRGEKWFPGNTIHYSIGQGYVLITPLQLARAYALLANGGKLVTPHLNADLIPEQTAPPLEVDPKNLQIVRDGLRMVVRGGTGRGINFSDMEVAGKTGTADHVANQRPHSWFVCYAPYKDPKVVVVVLTESAGGGGEVSLPIARQILRLPAMHKHLGLVEPADPTVLAQAENR